MAKKVNVEVDEKTCIGCTLCTQMCPKVFEMMDNGKARAVHPDGDDEAHIQTAIDACPVKCIHWKK